MTSLRMAHSSPRIVLILLSQNLIVLGEREGSCSHPDVRCVHPSPLHTTRTLELVVSPDSPITVSPPSSSSSQSPNPPPP